MIFVAVVIAAVYRLPPYQQQSIAGIIDKVRIQNEAETKQTDPTENHTKQFKTKIIIKLSSFKNY